MTFPVSVWGTPPRPQTPVASDSGPGDGAGDRSGCEPALCPPGQAAGPQTPA